MKDTHEYLVNTKFPEFNLYDEKRKFITEEDINGKWSVIFFYPKDESPGCTLQSCSFRDKYEEFNNLGVQIFGVSSDSVSSHKKFKEKHNLQYSLLSDKGGKLAERLRLKKNLGFLPARVTLIVDPKGIIIYVHTSQLGVTGHVRKALKEIKVREIKI
ncbi:MAG: peroxiredoxin [Rhodobacteraceae bacterium]|nr:peroxiredoxin [Paracoccaceae bacterium]|tara:strand:- start:1311 stop:1784 length:474 start_codon:yes stop_codon:yes gene_type:complete